MGGTSMLVASTSFTHAAPSRRASGVLPGRRRGRLGQPAAAAAAAAAAAPSKVSQRATRRGGTAQSIERRRGESNTVLTTKQPMGQAGAARPLQVCRGASEGGAASGSPSAGAGGLDDADEAAEPPWGWIFTVALWGVLGVATQAVDSRPPAAFLQGPPAGALLHAGAAFTLSAASCRLLLPERPGALRHPRRLRPS